MRERENFTYFSSREHIQKENRLSLLEDHVAIGAKKSLSRARFAINFSLSKIFHHKIIEEIKVFLACEWAHLFVASIIKTCWRQCDKQRKSELILKVTSKEEESESDFSSRMLKIKGKFEWWQKKKDILCLNSCRKKNRRKIRKEIPSWRVLVWVSLILSWWLLLCHESGKWIFCAFYASRARLRVKWIAMTERLCVGRITRKMKHKKHEKTWQWIWKFIIKSILLLHLNAISIRVR